MKVVALAGCLSIALGCLVACSHSSSVAESRARTFVRALIVEPQNQERLREVSLLGPQQAPEDLVDGVLARVAVDYLRAKQGQGTSLAFSAEGMRDLNEHSKIVTVMVAAGERQAMQTKTRVQVQMEDTPDRGWLVKGVQGGQ